MKKFIKLISLALAVSTLCVLCACGNTFEIKNPTTITLSGPSSTDEKGTSVVLSPSMNSADFNLLKEICKGKEYDEIDESPIFGNAKITFTTGISETTVLYPACDGSNYIQLYSLNPALSTYLKLSDEDMKSLSNIMSKHGIPLNTVDK